jgi:P27 family predicted phage terminase small subunit
VTARKPRAPDHLQAATKAWFSAVLRDYLLEPHHVRLLQLAGESWDRCQQARQALASGGITTIDDRGNIRAHPAVQIEKDSRIAFARIIRELDLDVEAPVSSRVGPPALRSNSRRA